MSEKKIVICDIDGTIANNDHRQHFLEGKKDWEGFFNCADKDRPIKKIIQEVISFHKKDHEIIFVSGRPELYRTLTKKWLEKFFNFKINLYMRRAGDKRNKVLVKQDIFYNELKIKNTRIEIVFENDKDLAEMWTNLGLKVFFVDLD